MKNLNFLKISNGARKILGLAAILTAVIFLGGCSLYGNQTTAPTPAPVTSAQPGVGVSNNQANAVSIKNFAFNPAALTVKSGDTVTWTNDDSAPHQIKSTAFNSDMLSTGQSFSFTFNQTGSYDYICSVHPSMAGKIIVE